MVLDKPMVAVIAGPTASGKSACAVELCKLLPGEIVSADSMQVYRGMDIGTAKAGWEERGGIPHHMLDVADPDTAFSAAMYREMALPIIRDIISRGKLPVICGGTGLYIDAVTRPMGFARPGDEHIRARLAEEASAPGGRERLHARLVGIDPDTAGRVSVNDMRRVIRALEIFELTGHTQTELSRLDAQREPEFDVRMFAPDWPRDVLYARIDRRVEEMVRLGLPDEVRRLMQAGLSERSTAMQALGYKEIVSFLQGEIPLNEAVDRIKMGTRRYAKRQLCWFRRDERLTWLPVQGITPEELVQEIASRIRHAL